MCSSLSSPQPQQCGLPVDSLCEYSQSTQWRALSRHMSRGDPCCCGCCESEDVAASHPPPPRPITCVCQQHISHARCGGGAGARTLGASTHALVRAGHRRCDTLPENMPPTASPGRVSAAEASRHQAGSLPLSLARFAFGGSDCSMWRERSALDKLGKQQRVCFSWCRRRRKVRHDRPLPRSARYLRAERARHEWTYGADAPPHRSRVSCGSVKCCTCCSSCGSV